MSEVVIVINPGSTTLKLGVFARSKAIKELELPAENPAFEDILRALAPSLKNNRVMAVAARGGLLRPLAGGVYAVNDLMLADLAQERYGRHASNRGAPLAATIARHFKVPAYVVDPVTTDELELIARISGVPGSERSGRGHALNIKAVAREACRELNLDFATARFVVAHLGGGITIAALAGGRMIDVNDALLGMGPFSPRRAGALPLRKVLDLAYSRPRAQVEQLLTRESGLTGYLGTDDLVAIERRIGAGDETARQVVAAMIYQIAKEIGSLATVLNLELEAILLTGGMARSQYLVRELRRRIARLGLVLVYPGQMEMLALARGGWRVIDGQEQVLLY
ncbi:MAG: butyrate kinase [Candidatus Neomarinimicrobiota bacterium]